MGRSFPYKARESMPTDSSADPGDEIRETITAVRRAITRPYPVTVPMVSLMLLVPLYLVIARRARESAVYAPEVAWDGLFPLRPSWALIYGALYLFLIVLPVFVVQQTEMIRRTFWTYVIVWVVGYVCFLLFPTTAPRPDRVIGDGFAAWGLRFLYEADPPYNCFPSIHVAHSFVSALACRRVHRNLGFVALSCAALVALSTLFTKQHYVADVIAGTGLALAADSVVWRGVSRPKIGEVERRVAPALALCVSALVCVAMLAFWVAYQLRS
jgi:membrane-associated phospholipid phosphatase